MTNVPEYHSISDAYAKGLENGRALSDADHAATVAELRAEVERLRKSNELYSFAMNTAGIDELKRRADAAERRAGELEAVLRRISTMNAADDSDYGFNEWGEADCFNQVRVLAAEALTGADPT